MLNMMYLNYRNMNGQTNAMFTFTSMHGVSHPYITEAFKRWNFKPGYPVVEQMEPHPDFPTVKFPNPEEGKSALVSSRPKISIVILNSLKKKRFQNPSISLHAYQTQQ